jgi:hypothetical protein
MAEIHGLSLAEDQCGAEHASFSENRKTTDAARLKSQENQRWQIK